MERDSITHTANGVAVTVYRDGNGSANYPLEDWAAFAERAWLACKAAHKAVEPGGLR
jgi:hypothetical protein